MAGVRHPGDRADHIVHAIGLGFTDIDTEMRESMATNHALSETLAAAEQANRAKTAFLSSMVKLRHARRADYDLILIDWRMPEMDGVETARRIRSFAGHDTPIIILT